MRNLLLASAFLATATLARAENGATISVALDDAPALIAPLNGAAFIDPVFPDMIEDRDEELVSAEASDASLEVFLDYAVSKSDE